MTDTAADGLTDGVTANATDWIYALRTPFGAGDDRKITPAYIKDYILGTANTFTALQTFTSSSGIRLGTGDNLFELNGRTVTAYAVPYLRARKTNAPTAFDVVPNGTGGAEVTGKAWMHVLNSDVTADPDNWEGCVVAARADGMHCGSDKGGTGTVRPFSIFGSTVYIQDSFLGAEFAIFNSTGLNLGDNGASMVVWTNQIRMPSGYILNWYPSADIFGTPDIGLVRAAAGFLKVTDGASGGGTLQFGAFTATGGESYAGYITVKDAGGTTRKLAVFA